MYKRQGEIPSTATAPGLEEARERLKLDSMTKDELAAYYRHLDNIVTVSYTHLTDEHSIFIIGSQILKPPVFWRITEYDFPGLHRLEIL